MPPASHKWSSMIYILIQFFFLNSDKKTLFCRPYPHPWPRIDESATLCPWFPDFPSDVQRFPKKISHGFSIRSRDDSSMVNSPWIFPMDFPIISRFPHETPPFMLGNPTGKNPWGNDGFNLRAWWSKRIQPGLPDSRWPAELLCELKLETVLSVKEDTMWIKIQQKLQRWY